MLLADICRNKSDQAVLVVLLRINYFGNFLKGRNGKTSVPMLFNNGKKERHEYDRDFTWDKLGLSANTFLIISCIFVLAITYP